MVERIIGILVICVCLGMIYSNSSKISELEKQIISHETKIQELTKQNEKIVKRNKNLKRLFTLKVKASAYTPSIDECNADNMNTALMEKPKPGKHIAVSHDLMWLLGKQVYIKGYGVRYVADLMNERFTNKIDIMFGSKKEAIKFGTKDLELIVILS